MWKRTSVVIVVLMCVLMDSHAYRTYIDVDSIGDLWIITLDKTGSMLKEVRKDWSTVYWSRADVTNDVIRKLSKKGGVLDQICYEHDKVIVMETGYGLCDSDSHSSGFQRAQPLESSFIHVVHPLREYGAEGKNGLRRVLETCILNNNYAYRESFVSQIRVLSLHKLIEYIRNERLGQSFNKINIVTVTDDADENDQWRMDYYTIRRDPKKMDRLNELHSRYVYSSFTQKGGGYLDENESFRDISSKNHIYLYKYETRQQKVEPLCFDEAKIVDISPLDGKEIRLRLNVQDWELDSVCFVYIDSIVINHTKYPIGEYLSKQELVWMNGYDMDSFKNKIRIKGKLQVQYEDSIYGTHFKALVFDQTVNDYTVMTYSAFTTILVVTIGFILALLVYFLIVIPYRKVMVVYDGYGKQLHIRKGFRWQWDKLSPLYYHCGNRLLFAKHSCYKRVIEKDETQNCDGWIIIDSPRPLLWRSNVDSESSNHNISEMVKYSKGGYPEFLACLYSNTLAGKISVLHNSNNGWVRKKIYPHLNKWAFRFCPHYYYYGKNLSGLVSSPLLSGINFLMERDSGSMLTNVDDRWLTTYYRSDMPAADVLVCCEKLSDHYLWDVYKLNSNKHMGCGIGSAMHLIHYKQETTDMKELTATAKRLKQAIKKEMKVNSIAWMDNLGGGKPMKFQVKQATCMTYICLVDNTEERKAQIIYSPLTDSEQTEKNVLVNKSSVSRLIWTSLVPFASKKDLPSESAARMESLNLVRESVSYQQRLILTSQSIKFDNIKINTNRE